MQSVVSPCGPKSTAKRSRSKPPAASESSFKPESPEEHRKHQAERKQRAAEKASRVSNAIRKMKKAPPPLLNWKSKGEA